MAEQHGESLRGDMSRVTLRFGDPEFERAFRAHYFRQTLTSVRSAYLLGVVLWIVWGLMLSRYLGDDRGLDQTLRYGVFIPLLLLGLALSFSRGFQRSWEVQVMAILLITAATWITYVAAVESMPVDYGYVGLILILAVGFTLLRLRFVLAALSWPPMIAYYLAVGWGFDYLSGRRVTLVLFYFVSFWVLGMVAAYTLERNARLLFLRERQLDREHRRSESLLLNILPQAIVDRLKVRQEDPQGGRLAEGLPEVTVIFVDAAGFTHQTEKTTPDELVGALDELFTKLDELADRFGLEKIKTVGDAYMAVAGAPHPRPDHAEAAADMALAILDAIEGSRWPSGDPVAVRMGIASGPVVAGVIGHRKFAYDLWGDTVNLASRLESHGRAGRILVSEGVAERLRGRYVFGRRQVIDLKGKGPTPARFLTGRVASNGPGDAGGTVVRAPARAE
jgi:class 3 adenylate cyclase